LEIPVLSSRAAVDEIMDALMSCFAAGGSTLKDQAAPSVDLLVQLLDRMPHPVSVDRHLYISIVRAAAGCWQALDALDLFRR
jgi:hypothetical protein